MTQTKTIELVRGIGRWSLAGLVVNTIIGSGIFGLPSLVAGLLGGLSPIAYILGAAGIGVIAACFAEVSSRFREAGGPYLYARRAFGPLIGIQTAWLFYLTRVTGLAANSNLFVIYLSEFWPAAREPKMRIIVIFLLVGGLAAINYAGVKAGARISDFFAVAKLVPLLIFAGVGLFFIHGGNFTVPHHAGPASWFDALLILVFAFKGFEAALVPAGEAQDPQRDAPWALFVGLALVTVIYTLVQVVVVGVLANAASTDRPLADAAQVFMGSRGAGFLALGALLSIYGLMSSMMLNTPRLTFALAERGDFPPFMAAVHLRFRTPHVSIVVFAVLVFLLASAGTFRWNVTLSAVASLFIYVSTCAAVPALRKKEAGKASFVLPAGWLFATLGIVFCIPLAMRMDRTAFWIILATIAIAGLNWVWTRKMGSGNTS
jgi:basic amino acid/polyamine antiporter, APA family